MQPFEKFFAWTRQPDFYGSKAFHGSSYAFYVLSRFEEEKRDIFLSLPSEEEARRLTTDLRALTDPHRILFYPAYDRLDEELLPPNALTVHERLKCLAHLSCDQKPVIVISTSEAVAQGTIPASRFLKMSLSLMTHEDTEISRLCRKLVEMGYRRDEMVASRGEFSQRGDILDVFPSTAEKPFRVEFFGDTVESIRSFDLYSQRSLEEFQEVQLFPVQEFDPQSFVWNQEMPEEYTRFFQGESSLMAGDLAQSGAHGLEWLNSLQAEPRTILDYRKRWLKPGKKKPETDLSPVVHFGKNMELLLKTVEEKLQGRFQVLLFFPRKGFAQRVQGLLKAYKPRRVESLEEAKKSKSSLLFLEQSLNAGFESQELKLSCITYTDFTGAVYQPTDKKKSKGLFEGEVLHHFSELNVGDHVIHVEHGIARFTGLETILIDGIRKEYLVLQYAGTDKVLLPITDVDRIYRHTPIRDGDPKLNKLNSVRWSQIKGKAKEEIEKYAKELLEHYARREVSRGHRFSRDNEKIEALEAGFEYDETRDQLKAVEEIKRDMEDVDPMDRLLCGDVGYGKTEVAVRAAFKAVQDQKQVAVLCPTTILAQQHFQTFSSRLLGSGARVQVLNRFVDAKRTREILKAVEQGEVDILVGTHRLLSKDVRFTDLGLLVVDEEQRFGVAHKEKLRQLKRGVDTLCMSATPIPRSLHMSLSGARAISVIHTPPTGRLPVKTYVLPWQESTVKAAMERELRRGGQIFYVYNRVETIGSKANQLLKILPGIRLRYLHGQMEAQEIEDVMTSFLRREFDVLLATTIIESGMDIPNVNTILVDNADHFGLAQLYQLRGRIGRRDSQGYAYLFYKEESALTDTARRRLSALEEFTDLGSGFKIAMRDLEIRGAGSILGKSQSGHVHQIGFDLYAKLLRDAIERLKDGSYREEEDMPQLELRISAFLSSEYIPSYRQRMDFFRRISWLRSLEALEDIRKELFDRYGPFPLEMRQLFELVRLRIQAHQFGVKRIVQTNNTVRIEFHRRVSAGMIGRAREKLPRGVEVPSRFPDRLMLDFKVSSAEAQLETLLELFS